METSCTSFQGHSKLILATLEQLGVLFLAQLAFCQNIKTVRRSGRDQESTPVLLSDKVDLRQNQEKAPPFVEVEGESFRGSEATGLKELSEALDIAKAFKTIRRDASISGQEIDENLDSVLHKQLSKRFNSLVLIPSQDRESVITRTPSRSIATSTPAVSPNPPPIPPKRCQSFLGPILPPKSRSCSPTCSEVSSIHGEVFSDSESFSFQGLPSIAPPPRNIQNIPEICVSDTMEDEEKAIYKRSQDLVLKLQDFDPNDIDETDLEDYKEKLNVIDEIFLEIARKIQNLVLDYETTIEAQRKEYWNVQITKLHSDVKTHRKSV